MTVKVLVKNHLNELLIPNQKGISLSTYERLNPSIRMNLRLLEGNRNLEAEALEKVLSDNEILTIVNSLPVSEQTEKVIEVMMRAERELELIKNTLNNPNVLKLTSEVRELYTQMIEGRSSYWSSYTNLGSTVVDISQFLGKYQEKEWNLETLTRTIAFEREYKELENDEEKQEYLKFMHYTYIKDIPVNILQHFHSNNEDFEFFQYIHDQTKNQITKTRSNKKYSRCLISMKTK
jgi:hypothetical protein